MEKLLNDSRRAKLAGALFSALLCALPIGHARAEDKPPLKICMAENNPPLSHRVAKEMHGLDALLARAIAAELGRPLAIVGFESEYDRDTSLTYEVNALLSSGVCELTTGYPLLAPDLGPSGRAKSRTPGYDGAKPRRQRPFVPLGVLVPTRPYQASVFGVVMRGEVLRDRSRNVNALADLKDLRIGSIAGTMTGSALMMYRNGLLRSSLVSLSQNDDVLAMMEAGTLDATLVPLNKFDAYRLAHPDTRLGTANFVHPLRMNLGLVGLATTPELIAAASRTIEAAMASGELAQWARTSGVSWVRPEVPDVSPAFSWGSLRID